MLSRSSTYLSLLSQANHSVEWRVTVNGTVYGKDKLAASTGGGDALPRLTRNLFTGSTPTIGGCCAATFECTIFEASSNVPRMATVVPTYRLVNGNTTSEWITLGTFYIDTRSVNKSTGALSLFCYDRMLIADGAGGASYADVTGFDEWPQTMSAVVNEIASIMGVTVDSRTSINSGTGYNVDYPNDLTMREVLGYIAVAHCGNWCITPDNKLRLIPLTGGNGSLNLGSATGSLKAAEKLAGYTGVTVYYGDEDAYDAGTDTGMTIVADCPWATQETASGMLTAISGYEYQPYTASGAFADLALELGDSLTVGLTGQTVTGPCFCIDITCDVIEAMDISAPGEAEVDHEYPYTDYVDRSLKRRVGLGQAYYGVTISRRAGIEIKRSDGLSEALFNSDLFTMRARIDGTMKDRIYFDPVKGDYVFDGALGADAVFTDALYADQGDIAELTVDELSTSRRVRKYILGDTSDDNYIHIKGQFVRWITGSVVSNTILATEDSIPLAAESGYLLTEEAGNVATSQATNRYGEPLYWQDEPVGHTADGYPTDADGNRIYATTEHTIWPVTQYAYTELIKTQLAFEEVGANYIPKLILGAGDEFGRSKGYLYKDDDRLILRYNTRSNKDVDITFSDEGFVDAMHRRLSSLILDTDSHTIVYTMEGSSTYYTLGYRINSDTITFVWPDGHTCDVNIPDDEGGGGGGGGGEGPTPASSIPQMDGEGAAGVSTLYSRGDHQHPSDTTRQALITASGILKGNGSGGVSAATPGTDYQAPLTFDSTPTNGSTNPVTSDGVYDAILDRMPRSASLWSGNTTIAGTADHGTTITLDSNWSGYTGLLLILNTASDIPTSSRMVLYVPTVALQFNGYYVTQNDTTSGVLRVGRPSGQTGQLVLTKIDFLYLCVTAVYGIK